ncbi:hypothetical protein NE579_16310, partial [Intestinimonas massiliensis]
KLQTFSIGCRDLGGRAFLDHAERVARQGYYAKPGSPERILARISCGSCGPGATRPPSGGTG